MTKEQLSCEKTVLQKNLLHYEDLHGRPVSRAAQYDKGQLLQDDSYLNHRDADVLLFSFTVKSILKYSCKRHFFQSLLILNS